GRLSASRVATLGGTRSSQFGLRLTSVVPHPAMVDRTPKSSVVRSCGSIDIDVPSVRWIIAAYGSRASLPPRRAWCRSDFVVKLVAMANEPKFQGTDYYQIEELLEPEERLARDTARQFVEQEYLPVVAEHFRTGTFPVELSARIGALGFYGANLPTEYGCAGLNNVAYGLINQEL